MDTQFFSHSQINLLENNFFNNPPPVADFRLFTPMDSTDPTIVAAAVALLEAYGGWDRVPEVSTELVLPMGTFWMQASFVTSQVGLPHAHTSAQTDFSQLTLHDACIHAVL